MGVNELVVDILTQILLTLLTFFAFTNFAKIISICRRRFLFGVSYNVTVK